MKKLILILFLMPLSILCQDEIPEWEKIDYEKLGDTYHKIIKVNDKNELLSLLPTGIFKSSDHGINWKRLNMPDSLVYNQPTLVIYKSYMLTVGRILSYDYKGFSGYDTDCDSRSCAEYYLISNDYGNSWKTVKNENNLFNDNIYLKSLEKIDNYGDIWGYGLRIVDDSVGQYSFYYSIAKFNLETNACTNYLEVESPMYLSNFIIEDSTIMAFSNNYDGNMLNIFKSSNLGKDWDTLKINNSTNYFSQLSNYSLEFAFYLNGQLHFYNKENCLILDTNGQYYETIDTDIGTRIKLSQSAYIRIPYLDNKYQLWFSIDTMKTWKNISYNLPIKTDDWYFKSILLDFKNNLYFVSSKNILKLIPESNNWEPVNKGLVFFSKITYTVNSKSDILIWEDEPDYFKYFINDKLIIPDWDSCFFKGLCRGGFTKDDKLRLRLPSKEIAKSEYPFKSFKTFYTQDSMRIEGLVGINENIKFYLGYGSIKNYVFHQYAFSRDNGETWEKIENVKLPGNRDMLYFIDETIGHGRLLINNEEEFISFEDSAKFYLSNDKGKSWKLIFDDSMNKLYEKDKIPDFLIKRSFLNHITGFGYALYSNNETTGAIYLTSNHGKSWTGFNIDYQKYELFLNRSSPANIVLISDNNTNFYINTWDGIYRSSDTLKTFQNISKGQIIPYPILSMEFGNDGRLYAVNYNGIWRTKKKILNSVEGKGEQIILGDMKLKVYPNPAGDYIEISVNNKGLKPFAEIEKIQIFDMLGIEVLSELINPMNSSHRMNVESLQTGVYFIKIGDKAAKFVKM